MTEFTVKLADVPIKVTALFPETKEFCAGYLTEEAPAVAVGITRADISDERSRNKRQMELEGCLPVAFSDAYMETLALYRKIAAELLGFGVLLFHASVLAFDGKAYAFTAKTGTGKTTHCKLWLENIPGCHILNGDKPLLMFKNGKVFACGTPWMGKENFGRNEILPLAGICILDQGADNHIEKIEFAKAFPALLTQTHRPDRQDALSKVVQLMKNLEGVAHYRLNCNTQPEAARVSYNGMVREL